VIGNRYALMVFPIKNKKCSNTSCVSRLPIVWLKFFDPEHVFYNCGSKYPSYTNPRITIRKKSRILVSFHGQLSQRKVPVSVVALVVVMGTQYVEIPY